jgi:hypothetical protein
LRIGREEFDDGFEVDVGLAVIHADDLRLAVGVELCGDAGEPPSGGYREVYLSYGLGAESYRVNFNASNFCKRQL